MNLYTTSKYIFILTTLLFALPIFGQVDSLKNVLKESRDTIRVDVLNRLSFEFGLSQPDSSKYYGSQALDLSRKLKYYRGQASAHRNIGFSFHVRGQLDSALIQYSMALPIQESLGDDPLAISTLRNNMGAIYNIKGNFPKALECYQIALRIKKSENKTASAATTLNNIGIIHYQQKNHKEALEYFRQALGLDQEIFNYRGMTRSLGNIGLVHLDLQQFDKAREFYQQAYSMTDSVKLPCKKLYSANGLGEAYFEIGDYEKALVYSNEALLEAKTCEDPVVISTALETIGQINIKLHRYQKGEQQLLSSLKIAEDNGLKIQIRDIAQILYAYYRSQSKPVKALFYHEKYANSKDSLFNEDLTQRLTSMAMNYAFEQEKDSIQFAQQKVTIAYDAELDRRELILWMTVLILVLALIFLIVVYRFYLQKRRANEGLSEKNQVISDALEEREVLLQEVHHRVKNNLQIVSSLLNIQSKYLKDDAAKLAILEGRDRVISMSMVHQRLYRNDNLSRIKVHEYLNQLAEALFETYKIEQDKIILDTSIEALDLDLDTSIHLGLIVNELISNALKHAFGENEDGKIKLSLSHVQNHYELRVSDNGRGISDEADLKKSHGFRIVESLVRGLSGTMTTKLQPHTSITVTF